jgi:hypothetical protein
MIEEFKDIPEYEGLYQVSNLGNVKGLSKNIILKKSKVYFGYYIVSLYKDKIRKSFYIHKLVAITFLEHKPCGHKLVIDHINDDPCDNRVENLQIVSQRFNSYKTKNKYSSKLKGVGWHNNKWRARIQINNKTLHLGHFKTEEEAHEAYKLKLKTI